MLGIMSTSVLEDGGHTSLLAPLSKPRPSVLSHTQSSGRMGPGSAPCLVMQEPAKRGILLWCPQLAGRSAMLLSSRAGPIHASVILGHPRQVTVWQGARDTQVSALLLVQLQGC